MTSEKLIGMVAHLQWVLHCHGIKHRSEQPSKVKASFCGNGGPGKAGVIDECRRRGWDVKSPDQADAIALYWHGLKLIQRERGVAA